MDEFGTAKKQTGFLHSISPNTPLTISPNQTEDFIEQCSMWDQRKAAKLSNAQNLKDQCHSILKKKYKNISIWIKLQPTSLKWNPKRIIIQDFFQILNLSTILKAHKSMPTHKLTKKKKKKSNYWFIVHMPTQLCIITHTPKKKWW